MSATDGQVVRDGAVETRLGAGPLREEGPGQAVSSFAPPVGFHAFVARHADVRAAAQAEGTGQLVQLCQPVGRSDEPDTVRGRLISSYTPPVRFRLMGMTWLTECNTTS